MTWQKWSVTIQALKSRILYWHWNLTKDQIWNTYKAHIQCIWCDYFLILWDNKTKYLGYDFQWAVFEIIVSLGSPPIASRSCFYLSSQISLPKVMLNAASRLLQTTYPPVVFVWGEEGWPLHRFSQGLEGSTEQVRSAKAGPSKERKRGTMGTRADLKRGVIGRKKRESFIFSALPITPFAPLP